MPEPIRLPRYLGVPTPPAERCLRDEDEKQPLPKPSTRGLSGVTGPPPHQQRKPKQEIPNCLPEQDMVLILGVPGAGKSTLIRELWWNRLLEDGSRRVLCKCRTLIFWSEGLVVRKYGITPQFFCMVS